MTTNTNEALEDHRELFDLTLEIGETAKRLEQLQRQFTEKLFAMGERQGVDADAMVFGVS